MIKFKDPYDKDPYQAKYHFLINKHESTGSKHFDDSKPFTRIILMIFVEALKNKTQIKNVKY